MAESEASAREEIDRLRLEIEVMRSELDHVAQANVHAALEMAAMYEERERGFEEREQRLERALEDTRVALRRKDEFLAKVSHELRTPLNGIIGMSHILNDSLDDPRHSECTATVLHSAEHLLQIINELLDLSRITSSEIALKSERFDLWEILGSTVQCLASTGDARGVQVSTFVSRHVPRFVRGDALRIRQVLVNLVGNALKFTKRGSVILECLWVGEDPDALRFRVVDTGCGIPEDAFEEIFDSFRQIDNSASRGHGGTGLGLAISRSLVDLMGGEIRVQSKLGVGSTFVVRLPFPDLEQPALEPREPSLAAYVGDVGARRMLFELAGRLGIDVQDAEGALTDTGAPVVLLDATTLTVPDLREQTRDLQGNGRRVAWLFNESESAELEVPDGVSMVRLPLCPAALAGLVATRCVPAAPSNGAVVSTAPSGPGLRVLVVEDNLVNQRVAQLLLKRMGHQVSLAASGEVALERADQDAFDVVLMDCQMPGMDGFETTRRLREAELGSARRIPILALTANALPADQQRCFEAGMDGFLSKPIDPEALSDALRTVASKRSAA